MYEHLACRVLQLTTRRRYNHLTASTRHKTTTTTTPHTTSSQQKPVRSLDRLTGLVLHRKTPFAPSDTPPHLLDRIEQLVLQPQ